MGFSQEAARSEPRGPARVEPEPVAGSVRLVRAWWLLLGASTLLLLVWPTIRVTFRHDALSFTLDTFAALVATMVAFVGLARYIFERRPFDLSISAAFGAIAVSTLWFGLILPFKGHPFHGSATAAMYGWIVTRLAAGGLLLHGLRDREPDHGPLKRAELWLGGVVALVALADIGLWYERRSLPHLLQRTVWGLILNNDGPTTIPFLSGQTHLGIVLESAVALLYCWLALRLTAAVSDGEDTWLALSIITAAVAELQFVFFPSPFHPAVSTSDLLWLVSSVLLLVYLASQFLRGSRAIRRQQARSSALLALSRTPVVNRDYRLVHQAAVRAVAVVAPEAAVSVLLGRAAQEPLRGRSYPIASEETTYGWLVAENATGMLTTDTDEYLRIVASQTASLLRAIDLYGELEEGAARDERSQLARELHDGLAQDLAVLRLRLGEGPQEAGQLAERALSEARYAITILRGQTAAPTDFLAALRRQLEDLSDRFGCPVEIEEEGRLDDVPAPAQVALLRIIREAVTNAGKHGRPSRILVRLIGHERGLEAEVVDDGQGFDPAASRPGRFGLQGMAERAELLGGELEVSSGPGGTRVRFSLPAVRQPEASAR